MIYLIIAVLVIVGVMVYAAVTLIQALKRRKEVSILYVDEEVKNPIKTMKVDLDFSHVVFPDGTFKSVQDHNFDLYIIKGRKFSNMTLSDGREISIKDGDCILVNTQLVFPWVDRFRLFLVLDEKLGVVLRTADEVLYDTPIVGSVYAKIPRDNIENLVWK